jgi:hypothetical protein
MPTMTDLRVAVDLIQQIEEYLNAHPPLQRQLSLLNTLPSLGLDSIATLLAEVADIRAFRHGSSTGGLCQAHTPLLSF